MRLLNRWNDGRARREAARRAYEAIVAQARRPWLYTVQGVPDTAESRYEAICLYATLAVDRLRRAGPRGQALADTLFQVMFRDIDANLRELGVGDLAVPKRVRRMGRAFNGRLAAYTAALARDDAAALGDALDRNLFRETHVEPEALAAVAGHVQAQRRALASQADEAILAGAIAFADDAVMAEAAA